MKAKKFFLNKYFIGIVLLFAGLFLGWIFFHNSTPDNTKSSGLAVAEHTIWTCSMDPQVRMDKPGKCPICGMDLIPLQNPYESTDSTAITITESAMKLAEIETSIVTRGSVLKEVRLYGKIQADESLLQSQTAHFPGRIEKLLVNVTGEKISKGQLIAKIYSPELVTAQKELLEAVKLSDKYPAILDAAREKLQLWKLTDNQIASIEKSGAIITTFDIYAAASGVLVNRKVSAGDYVNKGDVLYELADLSNVWAVFEAYESDLSWISMGENVEFTAQAIPGKVFKGTVSFIDPLIDPVTRITKVRLNIANQQMQFKPEMFLNGVIQFKSGGTDKQLTIPQSAVLWTGTRSIVYVKLPDSDPPAFKMREVTLGASLKDSYVVMDGLTEGEEIVTNGTFSVDAAAQLAGKPSMMNQNKKDIQKKNPNSMEGMKM
jgi:membrane fusion protein, copper/silver efflux system